jgi:hypothetical protein
LQRIEKSSLKTFLFEWLSKNKQYDIDDNTLNYSGDKSNLDENLKQSFENEISNFINSSSGFGGKNKKTKKNKKAYKAYKKTFKRYTIKKEKLKKYKKTKKTKIPNV